MSERTEYWWIRYDTQVSPAEVGFVGGIPARIRMIGAADFIPATLVELIERLPAPPQPVFTAPAPAASAPAPRDRGTTLLWLVGIILLIIIGQFSGWLFDALK